MGRVVEVEGGQCIQADLFTEAWNAIEINNSSCAIIDPPYGGIVSAYWDETDGKQLAQLLTTLMGVLSCRMPDGSQVWLWGGIGTPSNRALYRALVQTEDETLWQCAEQITWKKKRGYGTQWRCLMTREECLRFVLGDIRKPLVYNVQHTDIERGYAGFNPDHPAKSKFKRLTCIWDHASDMGQNKPHQCHKPEPLARTQILTSTNPGDTVLDLFAGSGEVSLTARKLGRRFVAYENDPEEFEKLVRRLSQ